MDIFDQAQALESFDRETALAQLRSMMNRQGPDIIEGVICCHECGEAIPESRLQALPGVGLCFDCQDEHDALAMRWKC
ncbi:MAG: TraR/DksA family transcriptional regulator [Pseudomonadota bacterium]